MLADNDTRDRAVNLAKEKSADDDLSALADQLADRLTQRLGRRVPEGRFLSIHPESPTHNRPVPPPRRVRFQHTWRISRWSQPQATGYQSATTICPIPFLGEPLDLFAPKPLGKGEDGG
jgi:hypothetical protein